MWDIKLKRMFLQREENFDCSRASYIRQQNTHMLFSVTHKSLVFPPNSTLQEDVKKMQFYAGLVCIGKVAICDFLAS